MRDASLKTNMHKIVPRVRLPLSKRFSSSPRSFSVAMSSKQHTDIVSKIPSSFERARSSGDLLFFESTIQKHLESGVNVRPMKLFLEKHRHLYRSNCSFN